MRAHIAAHGHLLARRLLPILHVGRQLLPVGLTRPGQRYLRHHRHVRVAILATARDLLASTSAISGGGILH